MPDRNDNLFPPIDDADDSELIIDTRGILGPRPDLIPPLEGGATDPQAMSPPMPRRLDPWDIETPTLADITGTGDAWLGEVLYSYDSAADNIWNQKGVIDVKRVSPYFDGSDALYLDEIQPAQCQPEPNTFHAFPFPMADQIAYHAAAGDPVTVFTGKDGRLYYIADNRPFVGEIVQAADDSSTKERNFGGGGNAVIKVRRVLFSGDPTSAAPTFSSTKTTITYDYVKVLTATGQHQGHRKHDASGPPLYTSRTLCFRRGSYMYALPHRGLWHASVLVSANPGPDSEADFSDERYWVQVYAADIAYTGDTNVWDWNGAGTSCFTIEAANLAEYAGGTHRLANGTQIIVFLFADDSTDRPYCVFYCEPPLDEQVEDAFCINSTYSPRYPAGNADPAWTEISATKATGSAGDSNDLYVTGEMYEDSNGDWNPWFVINNTQLNSYISGYVSGASTFGDIFCTYDSAISATDASGSLGDGTDVYADGVMYRDGSGNLNPRVAMDPTKIDTYQVKAESGGAAGFLDTKITGGDHITVGVVADAIDIDHDGIGGENDTVTDSILICGGTETLHVTVGRDAYGHVTRVLLGLDS